MDIDREAVVKEQVAEAEAQLREIGLSIQQIRAELNDKEEAADRCRDIIRFLKRYQSKFVLQGDPNQPAPSAKATGPGIRAVTQNFIRTAATPFTYADLEAEIRQHIPNPNPRSIRAELSFNKGKGLIEKISATHFKSLVPGGMAEDVAAKAAASTTETDRAGMISYMKNTDWSKVPDGPPPSRPHSVTPDDMDESDPFADE